MTRRSDYSAQLGSISDEGAAAAPGTAATAPGTAADLAAFLRDHSGLPGPRGNLELMQAAADIGDEPRFREWIAAGSGEQPTDEFLAMCGIVGFGRLVAEGRRDLIAELKGHASDSRWRPREAVAMALQRVGESDPYLMIQIAREWAEEGPYVQRAAVAGVSEPRLLIADEVSAAAVDIVDRVTALLEANPERRTDEFRVLRQALAYCWSVVVAANPEYGRPIMERLARSGDPDLRWILRENLKKARLSKLDPAWVGKLQAKLS